MRTYKYKLDKNKINLIFKAIVLIIGMNTLSSCANPFDLKAIQDSIVPSISTSSISATDIVAGGSTMATTAGGYKVTASLGAYVSQPNSPSPGGYKIVNKQQISK